MPTIFWASSPVRPGETAVLSGWGFSSNYSVLIARVDDVSISHCGFDAKEEDLDAFRGTLSYTTVKPLQASVNAIKFVVPSSFALGVYTLYAKDNSSSTRSNDFFLNKPTALWVQGPRGSGDTIAPSETLRIFGRALTFNTNATTGSGTGCYHGDDALTITRGHHHHHHGHVGGEQPPPSPSKAAESGSGVLEEQHPSARGYVYEAVSGGTSSANAPGANSPPQIDFDRSLGGSLSTDELLEGTMSSTYSPMSPHVASPDSEYDTLEDYVPLNGRMASLAMSVYQVNQTYEEEETQALAAHQGEVVSADATVTSVQFIPSSTSQGSARTVTVTSPGHYGSSVVVPSDLPFGSWSVSVHNGFGGSSGWSTFPTKITVQAKPGGWKTTTYNVAKLGLTEALRQASVNGGGVVFFPPGRYSFTSQIIMPDYTTLQGQGMDCVSLVWNYSSTTPPSELITGNIYGVQDLTVYANGQFYTCFRSKGFGNFFRRIRFRANPYMKMYAGPQPVASNANLLTKATFFVSGGDYVISNCDIYAPNFVIIVEAGKNGVISNNKFQFGGQGFAFNCFDRLIFENNTVIGNTFTSVGNGISSLSIAFNVKATQRLYYSNNLHQQYFGNNREMLTLDGAGGAYYGYVASCSGTTITLTSDPYPQPTSLPASILNNWVGSVMVVLSGVGVGQYRRVTSNNGRTWTVDRPFDVPLTSASRIQVTLYRGEFLVVGNRFEDGGACQFYGSSFESTMANNTGVRMSGFSAWGLNPANYGFQPSFFNHFLDNTIAEGNDWATNIALLLTSGKGIASEPLARFCVWRRNRVNNNGRFRINQAVDDCLWENNYVADSPVAFDTTGDELGSQNALRGNTTVRVTTFVTGPGATKFLIA